MITSVDYFLESENTPYRDVSGEYVLWDRFYTDFMAWLRKDQKDGWTKAKVREALGPARPVGPGPQNKLVVGNISDRFRVPRRYVLTNGKVRLED